MLVNTQIHINISIPEDCDTIFVVTYFLCAFTRPSQR